MTSIVPDLDTTTFEDLVDRARGQIPRYAPGWTDHNVHDPGITLLELLAWIVDQQVYRIGFVGDRHLDAFAALLGATRHGPRPAHGLLWPTRSPTTERALPAGVEVRCAPVADIPFVLDADVHLTPAALVDLVVDNGAGPVVVPNEGARTSPLALGASGSDGRSTLGLRFDRPLVTAPPAIVSVGFVVEPPPGQAPAPERHSWGPIRFEHRTAGGPWTPARVVADGTAALARTGAVLVEVPAREGPTPPAPDELRLVVDREAVPIERRIRRVEVNVLSVVQQVVEPAATLEPGTGLPDQVVAFDSTDLVDGTAVAVQVGDDPWHERDTFDDAGPDDAVYVRRPDALVFGNGVNGRVPPTGAAIQRGEVTRTRGAAASLRAGLPWDLPALGDDGAALATNPSPIDGGTSASDLAERLAAARRSATGREAMVTDRDLVAAALLLPGFAVARAEVLDGFHPDLPDRWIDGARTLVVIPHRGPDEPIGPPPASYLPAVQGLLGGRRVLGERLFIRTHGVVVVELEVTVLAQPGAAVDEVKRLVAGQLLARFTDVPSSVDVAPWPLGRTVTVEEVTTLAATCDGALAVTSCAVARAGNPRTATPVDIDRDELAIVAPSGLHIEVVRT